MKPTTSSGRRPLQWSLGPGSSLRNRRRGYSALPIRGGASWAALCPPTGWPLRARRSTRHVRYHCQRCLKAFMAGSSLSGGGPSIRLGKHHHDSRQCTACDAWTTQSASFPTRVEEVLTHFVLTYPTQTWPPLTLLGKSRPPISYAVGVCFTRGYGLWPSGLQPSKTRPLFHVFLTYPTESIVTRFERVGVDRAFSGSAMTVCAS
jgi:hypothetical protein